jgi:methyl-accepting chemotaxis protein
MWVLAILLILAEQIDLSSQNANRVFSLAESSTKSVNEVLILAEGGTEKVTETLEGMFLLKQKVLVIAHQILRLEQQTSEIFIPLTPPKVGVGGQGGSASGRGFRGLEDF